MPRFPNTPDCGIRDCTRAVYRGGLCRKHHELRPYEDRREAMRANMMEQHYAAVARRTAIVERVQAIVDAEKS